MLLELRKAIEDKELYEFLSQEGHNLSKEDLVSLCKELVWAIEENVIPEEQPFLYNDVLNELDDRLFDLEDLTLGDLLGEENIATIPIGKYYRLFIEDTKNDLLVEIIDNYGDIIDTLEGVTRETKAYELKKEGIRVLKCL